MKELYQWKEPCVHCSGACAFCMWVETKKCEQCKDYALYHPFFNFCPYCARPITKKAQMEMLARLKKEEEKTRELSDRKA